jgi:hypothetical protein
MRDDIRQRFLVLIVVQRGIENAYRMWFKPGMTLIASGRGNVVNRRAKGTRRQMKWCVTFFAGLCAYRIQVVAKRALCCRHVVSPRRITSGANKTASNRALFKAFLPRKAHGY